MAVGAFKIFFTNGSEVEVRRRPVHEVRAEQITKKDDGITFQVLAGLWAADTGGKTGRADFEAWLETVDDWERVDAGADADPPAQGTGTSPD